MFVERLNAEQKQALFDLAVMTAAVDNEVSEEEQAYLKDFSQNFGIAYDLNKSHLELEDLLAKMSTKEAKIITLQELMRVSYKDGHFGPEEQDKVFSIARKMGIHDAELLLAIERWVRQGFDWLHEGELLLS
jgi:tellurite resistance protein